MQTNFSLKLAAPLLFVLALSGCGGAGDNSTLQNNVDKENNVSSTSNGATSSAVGSDVLQSVQFYKVTPDNISLKGTGGAESALVQFKTLGQTGSPIKGIKVDFTLSSTVGGIQLSQTSATSDKDGIVSTSVVSGTVSTSVRVTATVSTDATITTQSNQLVISTGLPDQKSFSLAVETFNPAGANHNGVKSKVTVILSDAYNNLAADGTAVSFTTEGGSIEASCLTTNGTCSVDWISADPRPPRRSSDSSLGRVLCLDGFGMQLTDSALYTCQAERAGRSTILATAVGNESFIDKNSNGIFDPAIDVFTAPGSTDARCKFNQPPSSFEVSDPATQACDDLPEAYLDINENGIQDLAAESFIDNNKDATYTASNGIYNGTYCQKADESAGKCSRSSVTIRKEHMIVMSCDFPLIDSSGDLPKVGSNLYAIADCNGNALPAGSTYTIGSTTVTIGNQYDYNTINAAAGTLVKIKVGATESSYFTAP